MKIYEKPWKSVHRLNRNWKYFDQNFGTRELELIEKRVGKEWAKKWIQRRKIKSKVGCLLSKRYFLIHCSHIFAKNILRHIYHTFSSIFTSKLCGCQGPEFRSHIFELAPTETP